ncbi:4-hydroxybenzoate polyprenyltransferase [Klebsiella pneumoniae]|nr:4-hydroxybenzoate polyprenyltransferase [Klebsiella pneumoniae]
MEWSLSQNKLLAFHRLMRTGQTDRRFAAAVADAVGAMGGLAGRPAAVDPGGIRRRRLADARRRLRGE